MPPSNRRVAVANSDKLRGFEMVNRYDLVEEGRLGLSNGGRWVRYEDYAKLASLCGRMADLLKNAPILSIEHYPHATEYRAALAEWEAMK